MARLYTNENFPQPAAEELRRLGHDVLTVQEAGKAGQAISDVQVLGFAKSQERAIVTLNRKHFLQLHQGHERRGAAAVETQITEIRSQRGFYRAREPRRRRFGAAAGLWRNAR